MTKRTAILGATTNPSRYAYFAAERLQAHGQEFVPIGFKKGEVLGHEILDLREKPDVGPVDTVTLYIGPKNQGEWEDYILSLQPRRIIFNPGAENPSLKSKAASAGIETLEACTLVMLSVGNY